MAQAIQGAVAQPDDNLVNGRTYTFTFELQNWLLSPSVATIQQDIVSSAPDFLTSVMVTTRSGLGLLTNYYDVQFTYEGDGSDVVSDVANALIAAFAAGSNDQFTFVQALAATADQIPNVAGAAVQAGGLVLAQAGTAVGTAAGQITSGTLGGVTSGLGAWFVPVVLVLAVILLFQLGGVGGVKRSLGGT